MTHNLQERYAKMVLAKIRKELVLKDGVVFNNDYEGDPKAGAVKIPSRDSEVTVSDYDKANGISASSGSTTYITMNIDQDKAVNEVIDGYDAQAVPDNLVADRLDSAGYALAKAEDTAGGNVLVAAATKVSEATLTKDNIYAKIVDLRTRMSKANIPNDGKRYLLVTPDTLALILKAPEFIKASDLGAAVVQTGAVGKIAGFLVIEWNDETANLAMVAGHPKFATRVREFSVPVHVQDLNGSGNYIGASAVQGREVFGHKVTRSIAINAVFVPGALTLAAAQAATSGKTVITVTEAATSAFKYVKNPSELAKYGATYDGTALTSGTTQIAVSEGDILEVADLDSNGKVVNVGYHVVVAADIK